MMTTQDNLATINAYVHSSSHSDASNSHSSTSSMYLTESSGIRECFLSRDAESKSSLTTSSSGHHSHGSWEFQCQLKVIELAKSPRSWCHHKKSEEAKKEKRPLEPEDEDCGSAKRFQSEPCDDLSAAATRQSEPSNKDLAKAMRLESELSGEYGMATVPEVSKKRHSTEAGAEKRDSEPTEQPEIEPVMGDSRTEISLAKVLKFADDERLVEEKQLWQVPNRTRQGLIVEPTDSGCRTFLNNQSVLRQPTKKILDYELEQCLYTIHDYFAVVLGSSCKATFFYGVEHKRCYLYDRSYHRWMLIPHSLKLELSPDTLVYAEIVTEIIGESLAQRRINVLHIIDGHTLSGKNISHLPYPERNRLCTLYANALHRPSMNNVMPIRAKKIFELDGLKMAFERMRDITMKNTDHSNFVYSINSHPENNEFFIPGGIMFIKHTKAPYRRFLSKSNYKYFWAPKKNPLFDCDRPKESVANFEECYQNSLFWYTDAKENVPFNRQSYINKLMPFISKNIYTKRDEK